MQLSLKVLLRKLNYSRFILRKYHLFYHFLSLFPCNTKMRTRHRKPAAASFSKWFQSQKVTVF